MYVILLVLVLGLVAGCSESPPSAQADPVAVVAPPEPTPPAHCLDADGNGQADALSDGIVIVRYLFGYTGEFLVAGEVVDPNGTRNTPELIIAFLEQCK